MLSIVATVLCDDDAARLGADAGIAPSVGSRGDFYSIALAGSVIGLFRAEVYQRRGP